MSGIHNETTDSESASFLYGETKQPPSRRGILGRVAGRWLSSRFLPYVLLVVGVFLGLALSSLGRKAQEKSLLPSQAIFGKIPKTAVVFSPDTSYDIDPFGPDGLENAWSRLAPPGKGHIRIEDPASWQLSEGFPLKDGKPGTEEYTIALFHQLHCLAAIKSKMSRLQDWYKGENDKEYLKFALGEDQVSDDHIYHCFDYIRQALVCHGDTTLEKARTVNGKLVRGVDGWGVTHECRSWDAIYEYAAAHRSRNDTGIE